MSIRQRIVIDASVLRSAGAKDAEHPTSIHCRAVLYAILKICHKAALSQPLREEWDKHQSKYALQWRSAMQKRGKIIRVEAQEKIGLRQKVLAKHEQSSVRQEAALKDFHLVEAAIEADWTVISLDNKIRNIFADACEAGDRLAEIVWVHPNDADILEWLENGALRREDKQLLAYIADL